jgi:hypothetical protein
MLELPAAMVKLSSNSAKRMRLHSLQLMERCDPLGPWLGWMAARLEGRSFDRLQVQFFEGLLTEIEA